MCENAELSCDIPTPLGNYEIRVCSKGVHGISLCNPGLNTTVVDKAPSQNKSLSTKKQKGISRKENEAMLEKSKIWLLNYFCDADGKSAQSFLECPEICLESSASTDFEKLVWKTLKESTSIGDTISYGELASLIQRPKASRAVGTALKKNPIAIIVPCHRVIRSNGSLGNYSGGTRNEAKQWLYDHEQVLKSNTKL